MSDHIARKWLALAERRRDHLIELYRSGRWQRYHTEETFLQRMRAAVVEVEAWQAFCRPKAEVPPVELLKKAS